MKKIKRFVSVSLVVIVILILSTPIVNDFTAYRIKAELQRTPLPDKTEIYYGVSVAGKIVGSGNGMQFLGAILIKSELSLDELDTYYAQFRENDWSFVVEPQTGVGLPFSNGSGLSFSCLEGIEDFDGYYTIYTWGSSSYPLSGLDIRGH